MKLPSASLAALAGLVAAAMGAESSLLLDENGYFRIYHQFGLMRISSDALKAEGDTLFTKERLARLEKETKQHLKDRGIDWDRADWRDHACVHFRRTQLGDDSRAVELIPTVPPPADWAKPGFDDAAWLRQRLGKLPPERYMAEAYEFTTHLIRATFLRSYLQVPDPGAAGELTLDLSFRGGARVLVNGVEVARAHLPKGELGPDTPADDYPRDAYLALADEVPEERYAGNFGDIRCPWDQGTPGSKRRKEWADFRLAASRQAINQKGWERLVGLRDRKLTGVKIPAKLLQKGANVLAVELRGARFHPQILGGAGGPRAENWDRHGGTENHTWDHGRLLSLQLNAAGGNIPPATARPAGVQVWTEDMHTRVFSRDFNPPGFPVGTVRMVGAPNGTFAAQFVLGTDRDLAGLKAAATELKGAGSTIPASAVRVSPLKGYSILDLHKLGHDRCLGMYHWQCPMAVVAVSRYQVKLADPPQKDDARREAEQKLFSAFRFFDHISSEPAAAVPADTCQPFWLSLRVPQDARPGAYRGSVSVQAEGMEPVAIPVEVEVIGWRIPGPLELQSIVESEQSPYALAKVYKAELWSEDHWKLIEASFQQLARLGADVLFVPVLLRSEFGNREDSSMIKWIRAKDGSLRFDAAILDRYLDLAGKHCGTPRVVCFQIMHGCPSESHAVKVLDEATGKEEAVEVGPNAEATRRPLWRAFATFVREHMRQKGLEEAMYWGHAFDMVVDPGLVRLMAEFTPGIYWAAGAHARKPDATFRAVARSYGSDITDRSLLGWKNPFVHLVMPRTNGSVICVEGTSTPYTYRVLCDRAIYCGFNGVGRMGADYFEKTWFDGFRGGQYLLVGRSCVQTLWPGPNGAETSTRNEAMLEGLQEAEARIFLEQALDRNLLPAALAAEAQKTLDDHFRATLHIPGGTAAITMMDVAGDWQGHSRTLFATAAKAAEAVGIDVDKTQIGAERMQVVFSGEARDLHSREGIPLPALGKARVSVRLRNWTGKPRAWKAAAGEPWIQPAKLEGTLAAQEELPIVLDGARLEPGNIVKGTLTITDAASGRSQAVEITAKVLKPFDFEVQQPVFNVTVGEAESRDFLLVNRTATEQPWKLDSSAPWMKAQPASGQLKPGASLFVTVTVGGASLPREAATLDATLRLEMPNLPRVSEPAGGYREEVAFKTFVIPPYQPPGGKLPEGEPVLLETVSKDLLVRHRSISWFNEKETHKAPTFGPFLDVWHGKKPLVIGEKKYEHGLWIKPLHETVYNIEGKGFAAFSAEVGWNRMVTKSDAGLGHTTVRMNFEIHVDGKVVAQSGLMSATDPARLLVVGGMAGAKELKLVSRTHYNADEPLGLAYCNWANPTLYKGK
ncbi:MAG TPA: glycoside hydrolase domain-containing protein [Planctomycetota bacterium]|nr:glycoside hydrolase domain-containing protein [Planctomycetota bacterium]